VSRQQFARPLGVTTKSPSSAEGHLIADPACRALPDWNPWGNDQRTLALYRQRCRREAEEMTCAAQAAEILAALVNPGESLVDLGCGGGYYYWSLALRDVPVEYFGLDYTPEIVALAHEELCPLAGLPVNRIQLGWIEHLQSSFDNVLCFNVLTNSPHYGLPLERALKAARRRVILRESLWDGPLVVRYTPDPYLDEGKRHIRVYHNTYPLGEVAEFCESYGFRVTQIPDRRTNDQPELVVDIPHYWRILHAERC
jgi:SAM-dependent methyltransferase